MTVLSERKSTKNINLVAISIRKSISIIRGGRFVIVVIRLMMISAEIAIAKNVKDEGMIVRMECLGHV